MIETQIELEKRMTKSSIDKYRLEFEKSKNTQSFSNTTIANKLMSKILVDFSNSIKQYLTDYSKGKAVRSTMAADVVNRLDDVNGAAYITAKVILNAMWSKVSTQALYKSIGQAIEDEYKMRCFKDENSHYYKTIQKDLNSRGAKSNRKKNITAGVFNKRLEFHLDRWTITEKHQAGLVLVRLFIESTGLVYFKDEYKKKKHYKFLVPSEELVKWVENTNEKLELMQPLFVPMVCKPKEWTSVLDGGYISPYLKRNKFIKNNNKEYLKKLESAPMPRVYEAVNHLQNTAWRINTNILDVVRELWNIGKQVAELPDREDEYLPKYPYPEKTKEDVYTDEEAEIVKKWKRETYEIHKRNVQKRSLRILTSQILRIAEDFKDYEKIWFPHQMDFRGRVYPIPVLLQPQGSDLAKGLLQFANGKRVGRENIRWLQIHGANVYGFDKVSYNERVRWVLERHEQIQAYAHNPLEARGWARADKPFQFLAFCMEYADYLDNPDTFTTHIPIQLDGTCNGLQHYSALLRDCNGAKATNLLNGEKPNDIYAEVANKLEEKLKEIKDDKRIFGTDSGTTTNVNNNTSTNIHYFNDGKIAATRWLNLGINRKLTKRPVMVLPYGGTIMSCREYIGEYLKENYSSTHLWEHFKVGDNPNDCVFKVSIWLSKYLWEAISETLKSAIVGMDYLRKIARIMIAKKKYIEWLTPVGLLVRQSYQARKKKEIKTELYGSIIKSTVNLDLEETLDSQRQVNGICPNFIHSLDASCLMLYLLKCKEAGIESFMTVHDCYGTLAPDTEISAKLIRESFVEIYQRPILDDFIEDITLILEEDIELPEQPKIGDLVIEDVLKSKYFFN